MTRPPPLDPPPYPRTHTAADPSNVITETQVPSEAKALPSLKAPALILGFGGAAVALVAVILDYYELDLAALLLALVAVLMTVTAVIMAVTDQRTGAGAPIMCAIAAGVVLLVGLGNVLDVAEAIEDRQQSIEENTRERLEEARDEDAVPAAGEVKD